MFLTNMEYKNSRKELIKLLWNEDEKWIVINHNTRKCEYYCDLKNNIYDIISYLCNHGVYCIYDIDKMLLQVIIEFMDENEHFQDIQSFNVFRKLMEYVEDHEIKFED